MLRSFSHFNIVSDSSQPHQMRPWTDKEMDKKPYRKKWYWLFLLPFLGLLWPPLYAKTDPVLFGFPFFYWYQFAWVLVSAVLTGIVYLATRRR
jgi:uncharacterized protein DUF3311